MQPTPAFMQSIEGFLPFFILLHFFWIIHRAYHHHHHRARRLGFFLGGNGWEIGIWEFWNHGIMGGLFGQSKGKGMLHAWVDNYPRI